jgi:hypothetical protein
MIKITGAIFKEIQPHRILKQGVHAFIAPITDLVYFSEENYPEIVGFSLEYNIEHINLTIEMPETVSGIIHTKTEIYEKINAIAITIDGRSVSIYYLRVGRSLSDLKIDNSKYAAELPFCFLSPKSDSDIEHAVIQMCRYNFSESFEDVYHDKNVIMIK